MSALICISEPTYNESLLPVCEHLSFILIKGLKRTDLFKNIFKNMNRDDVGVYF